MTATQQPSVTQADRDIAAEYFRQAIGKRIASDAKKGRYDQSINVQSYARHRIAAYEAGVLDGTMKAVREMRKDSNGPKRKEPLTCRGEASE